jgi:esterase
LQLNYRIRGKGEPLVILHGLYGMSDNWMSVARHFEDRYQVILPDLRNHGHSGFHPEHTYKAMVDDVIELIDSLHVERISLMGHSMGGKVAMLFALAYPERVKKLIIVDIAPKNYLNATNFGQETTNHANIIQKLNQHDISKCESREEIDLLYRDAFSNDALRMFLLKNVQRTKNGSFRWQINLQVLQQFLPHIMDGFTGENRESKVDTLFIRGGESPYIVPDDLFYIKKFFPNAQMVTIDDAGHWVHAQKPDLFVATAGFFLS